MLPITIKTSPNIRIIGMKKEISFAENKTTELWQSFMPRRKEILNPINTDLYSMSFYPTDFFSSFDIHKKFEKGAGMPVNTIKNIPEGMQEINIESGLYATFIYKGIAANYPKIFQYVLQQWIPENNYQIDNRPFFEILGEKYKRDAEDSEEEVWIPVINMLMG